MKVICNIWPHGIGTEPQCGHFFIERMDGTIIGGFHFDDISQPYTPADDILTAQLKNLSQGVSDKAALKPIVEASDMVII